MFHGALSFARRAVTSVPFGALCGALLGSLIVTTAFASPVTRGHQVIVAANGQQIIAIPSRGPSGPPSFDGDSYDFQHQIGALIDGIFQCFSEHMSGMDDNTVLFDGLSELLDPYVDGTQPFVFEFETPDAGNNSTDAFFNSFSGSGGDLFPEGFSDPDTGTPLDAACIEIGIDDTLDADVPVEVTEAMIEASDSNGTIVPPTDITSLFPNPFDGRLSLVFPGMAGEGINGIVLEMTVRETDPSAIFADGFESGDASAWSDTTP